MTDDFFYALISGWAILLLFWTIVILFVYIRKPPNSKLTKKTEHPSSPCLPDLPLA